MSGLGLKQTLSDVEHGGSDLLLSAISAHSMQIDVEQQSGQSCFPGISKPRPFFLVRGV